jgi:hypothetical protein
MDKITKHLLETFCKDYGLTKLPEDKQFEHFAAYLVMSRVYGETFDTSDVVVGAGGDTSTDAIAIIVNGSLATEPEHVDDLVKRNGFLDATFVFVQAERTSGFDTAKIGQIGFGVGDFFSDQPSLPRNDMVSEAAAVQSAIYQKSPKFTKGNPVCRIFYATTGKWQDDQNLTARIKAVEADLTALGIFRHIDFTPVGADGLQRLYHQARNAVSRDFEFASRTVMPSIPGVEEAYLGLLPAEQYLGLITNEDGGLLRSVFYDNVRDWQNYNEVNKGIRHTLAAAETRRRFAFMNNGITIIAKRLQTTGNKMHMEDYQIVNGCQTSHVLYDNRDCLASPDVMIPLRIIATQDEGVKADIIKATNRQTEIREEQLLALSDFQKKLEDFFVTFGNGKRLYYERRSRQYSNDESIEKTRIVTMNSLVRAYASMFLNEPHLASRYYSELLSQISKTIFVDGDRLEPYYVAALAAYRLEYLFRNQSISAEFKVARYHMLMAIRFIVAAHDLPARNSHEMERYCLPLIDLLWDTTRADTEYQKAAKAIAKVAKGQMDRDRVRVQPFTEDLMKFLAPTRRRRG